MQIRRFFKEVFDKRQNNRSQKSLTLPLILFALKNRYIIKRWRERKFEIEVKMINFQFTFTYTQFCECSTELNQNIAHVTYRVNS